MNRREYLAAGTVGAVSSLCGCLSVFDSEVQLGDLIVTNYSDWERTIDVRVLDGETELQSAEVKLGPTERGEDINYGDHERIPCNWSSEPRSFVLEARLGTETETLDVVERAESDCVAGIVGIGGSRGPGIWFHVGTCEELSLDSDADSEKICSFVEDEYLE